MFKQIKFIKKYSTKFFNHPEITYSIFNCISKRQYCKNNDEATKIDSSHNHTIFEPYALSNTQSIILNRKRENLYDILNVGNREGFDIVTECPKLRKIPLSFLKTRVKLYTDKGVTMQILLKYPWLLTLSEDKIRPKLRLIKKLPLSFNESICFLRQNNIRILTKVCYLLANEYEQTKINRMQLIAEQLQCPVDEVCYATAKYHFFPGLHIERVNSILNILKNKNVPTEQILRDFWIFKYKTQTVARRLNAAKDANVVNIRTWMVRCKSTIYNRMLSRHRLNKQVLGNLPSITEYLSDRLNLNMLYAQAITEKHPEIKRMNITKAKNVIDYLFAEEYTQMHIIRSPRILCCKLETIQKRLQAFKEIDYKPSSLVIFCKSQAQFDKYFKMISNKLGKEKNEITDVNG